MELSKPTITIPKSEFDAMVEELCSKIATLEIMEGFASSVVEDFEDRFYHNFSAFPEIIKSTKEYFNKKRGE